MKTDLSRRMFLGTTGTFVAGSLMASPLSNSAISQGIKIKAVLVGTGVRGTGFWGRTLVRNFSDILEFVGLCDINPGRMEYAAKFMGVECPGFADFEEMIKQTKPDLVIVTTMDSTHHKYIIKGLEMGCDVLTENPVHYPDYANLGNNDRWIAIQNYQEEEWDLLISLWASTNRHIVHLIEQTNEEKLDQVWTSALDDKVSLEAMIEDYPRHFKLHLREIEELMHTK
jgi:hypothetical protein